MHRPLWQLYEKAVDGSFVNKIHDLAEEQIVNKATTFNDDNEVRSSEVAWLSHHKELQNFLWDTVQNANRNVFGFRVENFADIQYTLYHAEQNGHYNWHIDTNWSSQTAFDRKLSITVQLSDSEDYEGGDFSFSDVENPDKEKLRQKGTILIFPSYLSHRVSPVTKGTRCSLVAWFEGPRWT